MWIGNKIDLNNERVVRFKDAQHYANENGILFAETSAKDTTNVKDAFMKIGETNHFSFFF